ncbi:right-handed parallel beta-helix repeat-containing protein, partial [Candidatus Bathyarchaeota archaeon]|nr:right-handed parallel beta-helix repeat-containing protein [Candidatus Bathyarchaeota archaeon]
MRTRIAKVCNISGFGRRINGFNLRINQNRSRPKIVGLMLLSALLLCIPLSVYSALTTIIVISSTGQISTIPFNVLIGQYANGTYYAINVGNGQTYATAPSSASQLINNAIVGANSHNGGGTVQIGPGSFLLTSTIVPLSNVYLNVSSSALIYENAPATLSASISLLLSTSPVSNFTLNGGTWDANRGSLSDSRLTGTWGSNFFKYLGISIFNDGPNINNKIENVVLRNVIGHGINLYNPTNCLIYNCTVSNAGDNPITLNSFEGPIFNTGNSTILNCTVVGGQDAGINTAGVSNATIAGCTVSNVTKNSGSSHWGIAAEYGANVTISGNVIYGCDYDIVSTSDNVLITQNLVDGSYNTGANYGIVIATASNNIVSFNTITNVQCSLTTYGTGDTVNTQFLNNTCSGAYA